MTDRGRAAAPDARRPAARATPFTVHVPDATLADLRERLARVRRPPAVRDADPWGAGIDPAFLDALLRHWRDDFDWRAAERALNGLAHFRADVGGSSLHFVHERGRGPDPLPLLLTHGFPDSFWRMTKLIPLLTDPAAHGGDAADAFDVVVPSIPGYGFSDPPTAPGCTPARIADLFAELMTDVLGYARFGAHGGDWGSTITERLALRHPGALVGVHLTDIPWPHLFTIPPGELTEAERKYLEAGKQWQMAEGAYAMIQATRPQTLAAALADSPAGLAAWIVDLFRRWSDCDGDVERRFTKDELLTNVTLYWATNTIGPAARLYHEAQHEPPLDPKARVDRPTGVAIFPRDIVPAPREYAERFFDVRRWTEMPRGGHFAAFEEPGLLADDLRAFFRPLRAGAEAGRA